MALLHQQQIMKVQNIRKEFSAMKYTLEKLIVIIVIYHI